MMHLIMVGCRLLILRLLLVLLLELMHSRQRRAGRQLWVVELAGVAKGAPAAIARKKQSSTVAQE